MSNPQQPELARSRKAPHQDPDAAAGVIDAQPQPGSSGPTGAVPVDNQPGHHPPEEQDQPDLDAFAAKLGIPDEATGEVPEPPPDDRAIPAADTGRRAATVGVGIVGMIVGFILLRRLRRRRRAASGK